MNGFWLIALALALAGSAFIIVPLFRSHFGGDARDASPGLVMGGGTAVALLVPIAATLLYSTWTNWRWQPAPDAGTDPVADAHSLDEATESLRARLAARPDDVEGWRMLGRSYMSMQQFENAAEAYRRVVALTSGDVAAHIDYAEARLLSDPNGAAGTVGDEFIALAASMPDHPKAAWYAGMAQFERGNDEAGVALWSRVLALNPPAPVRQVIEQRLGMTGPPAAAVDTAPPVPREPVDAGPVDEASRIELSVTLDPTLASRLNGTVPLFIFARSTAGGPPLAVVRRSSSELPLKISLSNANTMTAGTSLNDHETLQLVARLSLAGGPGAQPGDMFGEVDYTQADGRAASIVIDQVVP